MLARTFKANDFVRFFRKTCGSYITCAQSTTCWVQHKGNRIAFARDALVLAITAAMFSTANDTSRIATTIMRGCEKLRAA